MSKWQYVAMFTTGTKGNNYFKFAYLQVEDGLIAPPIIPINGVDYVYAPDQLSIAKAFNTSQQNVSRWLKNKEQS